MGKDIDEKFECPEGFEECAVLELFSAGGGFCLEKTGVTHAVLTIQGEYRGQVYCSNPIECSKYYSDKISTEQKRLPAAQRRENK